MYKLTVYVPSAYVHSVTDAIFAAGGGILGHYEKCFWETTGTGHFTPKEGSQPSVGSVGKAEKVEESRVEILLENEVMEACIAALKLAHPYETPQWDIVAVECSL